MKKSTFVFFLVFLSGVLCANVLGVSSGRELGAMNEYFLNRYMYADIQGNELFLFLFYERVPVFFLLLFLSIGIYGSLIVDGYICYLGFAAGFLSVISIMNYGIKGVLLMMGFFLPQWIFYVPVVMIWRHELQAYKGTGRIYSHGEGKRSRRMKYTISFAVAGALFMSGLFLESYVNPFLLQHIIRLI